MLYSLQANVLSPCEFSLLQKNTSVLGWQNNNKRMYTMHRTKTALEWLIDNQRIFYNTALLHSFRIIRRSLQVRLRPGKVHQRTFSNCRCNIFTGQVSFLSPNQQYQNAEGNNNTLLMARTTGESRYQDVTVLDFIAARTTDVEMTIRDLKRAKAPVKSSPSTNQHPTFYTPEALPVTQPTVSKH